MDLSNALDVSMDGLDSLLWWYIHRKCNSFVEFVAVLGINVSCGILRLLSIKRTGCQLDHLRYVAVNFSSSTTILYN